MVDLVVAIVNLWSPEWIFLFQSLWIGIFLFMGRSKVTGSELSFFFIETVFNQAYFASIGMGPRYPTIPLKSLSATCLLAIPGVIFSQNVSGKISLWKLLNK